MPNGNNNGFPEFPTVFTAEDIKRLREIEERRKAVAEAYRGKFAEEAWARVPLAERAVRRVTPPWLAPVTKLLPGVAETLEFGFTPEQFQEQVLEMEEEFKELTRRQKVTGLLPNIQADIMMAALAGETITDTSELLSMFPELGKDFTEEEIGYLARLGQALSTATPEQIMSGEIFAYEPNQLPITKEDVESLFREGIHDPRQVFATVEFIKDAEDVAQALRDMYPAQVVEPDEAVRERLREYFQRRNEELGITPEKPAKEAIQEYHKKIAEEAGESLSLVTETGEMVSARKMPDNTIWVGEDLIGSYDDRTGGVVPFNLQGQPLLTEEAQESALKDLWDSFYLGLHQAWYGTKQALFNVIPQAILSLAKPEELPEVPLAPYPGRELDVRLRAALRKRASEMIDQLQVGQNIREAEFQEWLGEHPELTPRPEYTQSPIEHPELFKDPYYYAYTIISNAPIIGAALFVGTATAVATKNPWAGAIAGAAVITPVQINSVYEDLVANGADPANASELATMVGTLMGAVEILPGAIVLKAVSPAFMGIFRKNFQRELTRQVVKQLTIKGILKTATKIEIAETLEEVIQEAMQNAAVKTVNENRSLVENLPETAINAAIATAPLAFFGGGAEYINMRANLPPSVQQEIDETATKMKDAGLSEDHAEAVALAQVLEDETGQAQVEEAASKVEEVAPATSEKIIKMETRLTTYNNDIEVTKASIEVQQARFDNKALTSSERLEAKGALDSLQESLTELEADKKAVQKKIDRARRALEKVREVPVTEEVVGEVVPEVAELPPEEPTRPRAPDRRPKLREWEDEEIAISEALAKNPIIKRGMVLFPKVRAARVNAETVLNRTQDEYQEAKRAKNKDAIKEIETRLKAIAKEAGLRSKVLLGKRWGDLPPDQQTDLALSSIPDRSIHLPRILELADIKHYVRFLEEETGLPFYQLYPRTRMDFGASQRAGELVLRRLKEDPMLRDVKTSKESQVRAAQQINSKNPRLTVSPVEDLTLPEEALINTVEDVLQHYEPYVRYLRVMGTDPDIESFRTEFPDAVEMDREIELQVAIDLKEAGDYDGLWYFVQQVDWGVITGYTPWMKAKASIFPRAIKLGTTRGEARLMARSSIEFDETIGETLLLDVVRYVKQIEAQWRLRSELEVYEDMWQKVSKKFTDTRRIENKLKMWGKELQGMPVEGSIADDLINRVWKQAMSTVFVHLYMSFRNIHQPIAFHPDRTELVRILFQKLPVALNEKAGIYYDNFVTQLGGIRSDFLLAEGKGIPTLGWLTNMADRVSLYAHSDNIPRRWSFKGSVNKAWRATQEYQTSNKTSRDLARWVRASGVNHLTQTEKNYALQLLAQGEENINLAVPGLAEVSGYEATCFYIGHEVADITHFIYRRAFRAPAEMGSTGRLLYNLIVFPRSYVQRIVLQSRKIGGIFHADTNWETARAGFKDVLLLIVMGALVSEWISFLTGKERRAYSALEIIQWQLGGLAIGVGIDITEMLGAIWTILDPTASEEDRDRALGALPGLVERNAQVLVPFYRYTIDAIEATAGVEDIGVHTGIRKLRGMLDKDYTPPEIEEKERTLWEAIRHAVLGSEPQDPTEFQDIQTSLRDNEARLGELDAVGRYYTIGDFGRQIESSIKPLPDYSLLEEYGFSSMTIFYVECKDKWEELYKLPSKRREAWRKEHIYEEAMLLFWEKYSSSVFTKGSPEAEEITALLRMWFDLHDIDRYKHGHWADWTLPIVPVEEE